MAPNRRGAQWDKSTSCSHQPLDLQVANEPMILLRENAQLSLRFNLCSKTCGCKDMEEKKLATTSLLLKFSDKLNYSEHNNSRLSSRTVLWTLYFSISSLTTLWKFVSRIVLWNSPGGTLSHPISIDPGFYKYHVFTAGFLPHPIPTDPGF